LKCGWRVSEAKEHNSRLEEATVSSESGLPFITGFNANVVIAPANIKLSEVVSAFRSSLQDRKKTSTGPDCNRW
jgi:hypothetical protein